MPDFVYDAGTLPTGKTNARPLGVASNKGVTAQEWNTVMAAVLSLRTAVLDGTYHGFDTGSTTGKFAMRSAVPSAGVWAAGDFVLDTAETSSPQGWLCSVAGDFDEDPPTFVTWSAAPVTLGAFGSSPSSSGGSLSGQVLTLQPADATHPGAVTTGAQTIAGLKTLSGGASVDTQFTRVARTQTLTANGNTITATGARMHLSGASDFKLTSTPTLAAGSVVGQEVQLVNTGSKLVTLQGSALAGSTLKLRGRSVTLAPSCSVTLGWNGTSWAELSRATHGHANEHHVADFGAVGDNVTDDTAAIQAAIDAASLDGLPVVLEPGVLYMTSAELLVGAATVRFKGAGKFTGGIRCTGAAPFVLGVIGGTLHVSDLQIYAERTALVGIYIETATASVVERCHIYQPIVDGVQVTNSDSCRFVDVQVELCGQAFITANYAGGLPNNIKVVATGTVAATAGLSSVITGTGTQFLSMGIRTGDFVAVHATGAGDLSSSFLPVDSVDSDTQITCLNDTPCPGYSAGSDFAALVGNGYHEGPSRADNNNHLIDGWLSRNIAGCGIHVHGLYGPRVSNAQCDASGAYPVSVASGGVVTIGAHFSKMYFELNNAADNFYLGYVADILIDQVNGTSEPVVSTPGKVWGVIRGMQDASDPGRIDPLGTNPVDYVPAGVLVADVWAKGKIKGLNYPQNAAGLGSLTMKDNQSKAWAAISGVESPSGGADANACAFDFDTYTNVTPGASKRLVRWNNAGTPLAYIDFSGNGSFVGTLAASNLSGTNTGDLTLASVGSTPAAAGASLSGQVLTLQPANATNPGVLTTGTQAIAGAKTFSGYLVASSGFGTIGGGSTVQLQNGEVLNFSFADTHSYIYRVVSNTLSFGNGIGSTIRVGAVTFGQVSGSEACSLNDGARINLSNGDASAYLVRNAANVINTPGKLTATTGLGVGNSASATIAVGALAKKIEVFDASGSSLGFVPVYSSIT